MGKAIGPDPHWAAAREAVRTAEQTVSDAWLGRLLLAESEAEATVGACARTRQRAAERVRSAQRTGDLVALTRSQTDLEHADRAWGGSLAVYEHARAKLAHELERWADGTARRVREAWADRSIAGRR